MNTADKDTKSEETEKQATPEWVAEKTYTVISDDAKAQECLENWQGNTEDYLDDDDYGEYHYKSGVDAWVKRSDAGRLVAILLILSVFVAFGAFWVGSHKSEITSMSKTVNALKNNDYTVLSYVGPSDGLEAHNVANLETKVNGVSYKVDVKNIIYTGMESLFEHDGDKKGQVLYKCKLGDEEWYLLFVYKKQS